MTKKSLNTIQFKSMVVSSHRDVSSVPFLKLAIETLDGKQKKNLYLVVSLSKEPANNHIWDIFFLALRDKSICSNYEFKLINSILIKVIRHKIIMNCLAQSQYIDLLRSFRP